MLRDFFQNQHVTRNPAHQAARGPVETTMDGESAMKLPLCEAQRRLHGHRVTE